TLQGARTNRSNPIDELTEARPIAPGGRFQIGDIVGWSDSRPGGEWNTAKVLGEKADGTLVLQAYSTGWDAEVHRTGFMGLGRGRLEGSTKHWYIHDPKLEDTFGVSSTKLELNPDRVRFAKQVATHPRYPNIHAGDLVVGPYKLWSSEKGSFSEP